MLRARVAIAAALASLLLACSVIYAATESKTIENVTSGIDRLAKGLTTGIENATNVVIKHLSNFTEFLKDAIIRLSHITSVILALVGLFLWFSGISPYSGKRMVFSAVLLFALSYVLKFV